jgi:hypothetical protein
METNRLIMKYAFPLLILFSLLDLTTAQEPAAQGSIAQEFVPKAKWTKEQIENPPARDLKVDLLREPFEVPLEKSAPPFLAERKYVAIIRLPMPVVEGRKPSPETPVTAGKFSDGYLLWPGAPIRPRESSSSYRGRESSSSEPNQAQLKQFLTHVPAGTLDKETIAFFQSAEVDQGVFQFIGRRDTPDGILQQEFRIFGKSADECERLAKGLMTLLDYGFSRPLQLGMMEYREEIASYLKTSKAKLDNREWETELEKVSKRLVELKEFTVEMLPTLRQQQLVLEVNLAGTTAQIKACEKLLEGKELSIARRSRLEDIKIQAEIELAGHQAQRSTVADYIAKVNQRTSLSDQERNLTQEIESARRFQIEGPARLSGVDANLEYFAPLKVVDNKIVIRPVAWITR